MSNGLKILLATVSLVVVVGGVASGALYYTTHRNSGTVKGASSDGSVSNDIPSGLSNNSDGDSGSSQNQGDVNAQASTQFSDGRYAVGSDIQAGTYQASGSGDCHWRRLSSLTGNRNVIAEGGFTGGGTVTIESTDKVFEATNCGTWYLQSS